MSNCSSSSSSTVVRARRSSSHLSSQDLSRDGGPTRPSRNARALHEVVRTQRLGIPERLHKFDPRPHLDVEDRFFGILGRAYALVMVNHE